MVSDDFFDMFFSLKLGGGFGGFKSFFFSPLLEEIPTLTF